MNRRNVLFITSFHPGGRGVIGAGEAICETNVKTLVEQGDNVYLVCIGQKYQQINSKVAALCLEYHTLEHTRFQSLLALLQQMRYGAIWAPWLFTRVTRRNVKIIKEFIDQYNIDYVWLEFPSSLGFSTHLASMSIDYFVHDVVSQNISRRLILRLLLPFVRGVESRLLSIVSRCIVLSDKDKSLVQSMGFIGAIKVIPPEGIKVGQVDEAIAVSQIISDFEGGMNLVFFGSMRRSENHWSILYFLLFVYPKIFNTHKDVRFWVIGLSPNWLLKILGKIIPGLHVVGAVDDPVPAFRAATLCIVPLLMGAGVKIKVLQMLEAGANVVATPVGAEGISADRKLTVVGTELFADTVCRKLSDVKLSKS